MLCFFLFLSIFIGVNVSHLAAQTLQDGMVLINEGSFIMGSPVNEQGRASNESPQRQISLNPFYMGKYPVTQAEYEEIMGINPSNFKGSNLPVEQVSWFDAVEYCNKLSVKEGFTPVYIIDRNNVSWNFDANGYRLPTEAEWEYACRAGTQTPFSSGDSVNDAGWHSGNSGNKTRPVGEKLPNSWGLYDMHGNVLEWCWDWLGYYSGGAQTNPQGPSLGTDRTYRGGCWRFAAHQARSAYRFGNHPNLKTFFLGFRVVRNLF